MGWSLRRRVFEVLRDITCWNDGMGNCYDYPGVAITVEETDLVVPSPTGAWARYPFAEGRPPESLALPADPQLREPVATLASSRTRRAVVADGVFPNCATGSFTSGLAPEELRLWDWDRGTLTPLDWDFDALVGVARKSEYDHEDVVGAHFDEEGALWMALSASRYNDVFLSVVRAEPGRAEVRVGTGLIDSRAGGGFGQHGWGHVRFIPTASALTLAVGRPNGVEDRFFDLAWDAASAAIRVQRVAAAAIEPVQVLGAHNGALLVDARVDGDRSVAAVVNGRVTELAPVPRDDVSLFQAGDVVLAFTQDWALGWGRPLDLAPGPWEELSGMDGMIEVGEVWAQAMDDLVMQPPFPAPMPARCGEHGALFLLGLSDEGYEAVLFEVDTRGG